ncbi:MAG: adenylate kinase family protein [Terriglobia bacterium]
MAGELRHEGPVGRVPNAYALIMLGAPGAGKGTQAREVSQALHIPAISTGEMLREAARQKTAPGLIARDVMDAGGLVSDGLVCSIVEQRLREPDSAGGFILDGFPRTPGQAQFIDRLIRDGWHVEPVAINISVDRESIVKRLTGRRVCPVCGSIYNIYLNPPRLPNHCDLEGTPLMQRADDREDVIRERLLHYDQGAKPLLDHYRQGGHLIEIDGNRPPGELTKAILRAIRSV